MGFSNFGGGNFSRPRKNEDPHFRGSRCFLQNGFVVGVPLRAQIFEGPNFRGPGDFSRAQDLVLTSVIFSLLAGKRSLTSVDFFRPLGDLGTSSAGVLSNVRRITFD